jgi:two-component system cell cycle response regulator
MKVLVVDDSAAYRRLLERAVSALGHRCVVAEDGLQAWEAFQAEGADVVISNWMMPGIDGTELCQRIRSSEHPYAFFILFTALEGRKNVLHGMEAGADDYLAKPLNEDELEACLVGAERVSALHRRLGVQQSELERLNRELYEQSRQDPLTRVGNRLRMREDLEATEANAERYGRRYAVALCDVDRFKAYNDSRGHPAGDAVLRSVAEALRDSCRKGDAVYRYGGEELLVVLPGQGVELAGAAAERMREAVEALAISHPDNQPAGVVTISVGVAVRDSGGPGDLETVLGNADKALYEAKNGGRNRIVVHDNAGHRSPPAG